MIKKSTQGYKRTSPDRKARKLRIPSNQITMEDVDFPILGVDNLGNQQVMYPGENYVYPGAEYVDETPMAKDGKWIQKAVNPKHKGFCTPMTKSTCTPRRKAFAKTMKKHHGFHEDGGQISKNWLVGSEEGRMVAQAGASLPLEKDFVDPMAYHAALDAYMEQMRQGLSVPQVMQNKDLSKPAEMFGGTRNLEPLKDRLQTYTPPTGLQYTPSPNPFPNRDLSKPASMSPQKDRNRVNWGNTVLDALLMADILIPGDKIKDPVVRPGLSYNEHQYGTGSQAIAKHGKELPCLDCGGKMQAGGLLAANMEAKRFAKARGLISGEDTHVDQIPEYIDSATGKPTKPAFVKPKAYTVPNDIQLSDIQTDSGMYWYTNPKTGDIIDVDPSVVNLPRFRKMQAGGVMPGMTGQIYSKYAQAVSKYANKMEAGGDMPYNELLVHSEGNMHKKIAQYQNGGKAGYGKRMPILHENGGELETIYEEGGTYDMSDEEIKRLVAAGYELKIK